MLELKGNHISLDLETLDTVPGGAIVSIGAVQFNEHGITLNDFYRVVSLRDNEKHGMTTSVDTLGWWMQQSGDARKTLIEAFKGGGQLGETLDDLGLWIRAIPDLQGVWTNGPAFDSAFIAVAAKRTGGRKMPWAYHMDRDFRTIKMLSGLEWIDVLTDGTAHNALADAKNQARYLVKAFERMQAWASFPPPREKRAEYQD
jgi:hypothetical protein